MPIWHAPNVVLPAVEVHGRERPAAAIFIDGPPHDSPDQVREDDATTETLIGMGYIVIRFHHEDDWLAIFRRHADVFGTPNK